MGGQAQDGEGPTQASAPRAVGLVRDNFHRPIEEQHQKLKPKLQGRYGYYGITGNFSGLRAFLEEARKIWRRRLSRRRRDCRISWSHFLRPEKRYDLARARVIHSALGRAPKS